MKAKAAGMFDEIGNPYLKSMVVSGD